MNDEKLLNLAGGKILYDDLRDRIKQTDAKITEAVEEATEGAVKFNAQQTLTANEQAQARTNIQAASVTDVSNIDAVKYNATQNLTPEQRAKARSNISAPFDYEVSQTFDEFGNVLVGYNSYPIDNTEPGDSTDSGVSFTWSGTFGKRVCAVSGTPTSNALSDHFMAHDNSVADKIFKVGNRYFVHFESTGNAVKVRLTFGKYVEGSLVTTTVDISANGTFTIPDGYTNMIACLYVPNGSGAVNETVTVGVYTAPSNMKLWDAVDGKVTDVQVNGTSVVTDGVANVQVGNGLRLANNSTHALMVNEPSVGDVRFRSTARVVVPSVQHLSVFYGLAWVAGDTTQAATLGNVGTYTETAKSKISEMLSAPVSVTGTTPTITALSGIQYVCGEVATLDITLPASGIVDVVFESSSTPTVLTITPPTGMTIEWANGFDPTSLEADTLYELNIKMVGSKCLGVAVGWT